MGGRTYSDGMNELQTLKFTAFNPVVTVSPVQYRRNKLAAKLDEQIAAARAAVAGTTYVAHRVRRFKCETGNVTRDVEKRLRLWFQQVDDKRWCVVVFYGARQLELAKNKNAVETGNLPGVVTVLETLRKAVLAGELDSQIAAAAESLKRGFKK